MIILKYIIEKEERNGSESCCVNIREQSLASLDFLNMQIFQEMYAKNFALHVKVFIRFH